MRLAYPARKEFIDGGRKIFENDAAIRAVCIPLLGVLVPNITSIVTNGLYSLPLLIVNYVFFIALAWAIWTGNVRLMVSLKNNSNVMGSKYRNRLMLLLSSVVAYTVVVSGASLFAWHALSRETSSPAIVVNAVLMITALAVFISSVYENFFLDKEHADTLHRIEQLNLAKTHVELVALKNQIDPHFIFNSLNTLSYLISSDPANAKLYNDTLAKVYHYILMNREKNLVLLTEEIEFMTNYFYLLKIRFDKAVNMVIEINNTEAADLLIPPISLQILLENVMKHNKLDKEQPLTIGITVSEGSVVVTNAVNLKSYPQATSKVGLANLDNRYALLTGKNIVINHTADIFSVRLPLIHLN